MKHTLLIGILVATLLAGCDSTPAPQPTPNSGMNTPAAQATATVSLTNTSTPRATRTPRPTATARPTGTPKPTKTARPKDVIGCFAPTGTQGPTAPFKLENFTNRSVTVYINGVNRNGNFSIYCTSVVKQGIPETLTLMWGNYTYMVQIGGKGTLGGSFYINDFDKATMRIFKTRIAIGPFP